MEHRNSLRGDGPKLQCAWHIKCQGMCHQGSIIRSMWMLTCKHESAFPSISASRSSLHMASSSRTCKQAHTRKIVVKHMRKSQSKVDHRRSRSLGTCLELWTRDLVTNVTQQILDFFFAQDLVTNVRQQIPEVLSWQAECLILRMCRSHQVNLISC